MYNLKLNHFKKEKEWMKVKAKKNKVCILEIAAMIMINPRRLLW